MFYYLEGRCKCEIVHSRGGMHSPGTAPPARQRVKRSMLSRHRFRFTVAGRKKTKVTLTIRLRRPDTAFHARESGSPIHIGHHSGTVAARRREPCTHRDTGQSLP